MSATATTAVVIESGRTSALNTESSGGEVKRIHHIPWPATADARRRWQLEQMAGAFRVFAKLGFADGSSGHISLRGESRVRHDKTII